jgi:hypothetical protein
LNPLPFTFELLARDGRARAGVFRTPHGEVPTPAFAPVGTAATVKAVPPRDLQELGARLVLANTYHLYLRPGDERIARLGGLHRFMGWDGPLLTDSGGFQVFSLKEIREIDDDGVTFKSHVDGSLHRFTPEKVMSIQENLGADIVMALDECAPPLERAYNEEALRRTHAWAERCLRAKTRSDQALFGIVQGGVFDDLREQSARFLMGRRRDEGAAAPRARRARSDPARGQAALPDGRRHARGFLRDGGARHRPVRLRAADAAGAARLGFHARRAPEPAQRDAGRGRAPNRRRLRLLCLPQFLAGVHPPPDAG